MKFKKPEIMSPAGDFICLDAALRAGADAVYFGLKGSNMRVGARNFELGDLPRIKEECSKFGAKAYLTLNTIYFDSELGVLKKILRKVAQAGIDAVIAWDFSVIQAAREAGVEVFLSTQASVANALSVAAYFNNFGIKRFVLARECTLENMSEIREGLKKILGVRRASKIEMEVFAHGAMCVSMSGRCFMSQFQCGKSANRGECMQPCRREYSISPVQSVANSISSCCKDGGELLMGANYVLSPKDLCTLPFIEKLIQAGVNSLKIEGRNRNAQYVGIVTAAYKKARDYYFEHCGDKNFPEDFSELKKNLSGELSKVFTRGFSEGFFMGKPIGDWTSAGNVSTMKKVIVGHVTNYFSKLGVAEVSVDDASVNLGETVYFEGNSTGCLNCTIESMRCLSGDVETAHKGMLVGIKVSEKVRRGDRVYKLA